MPIDPPDPSPLEFLHLLAEPLRWDLLQQLAGGDLRVHELVEGSGKPQNLVSYHLRELRAAGLVCARRSSADGRDTYYRVDLDRCARLLGATGSALHPGLGAALTAGLTAGPTADLTAERRSGSAPRVLFLCTGNSGRSQIAEALVQARSGGRVDARSAGSHPKPLHPGAVRVMADRGIDISDRTSKHLRRFGRMRFDHVVTLCDKVREVCPELPGHPRRAHWSMPDPAAAGDTADAIDEAFARTADEIEDRLGFFLPQLIPPADHEETPHA